MEWRRFVTYVSNDPRNIPELLCRHLNRLHYGSCTSVRLSVPYVFLTQNQTGVAKLKLVRTFPRAKATGIPLFSSRGHMWGSVDGRIICWHWADMFLG